MPEIFCSEPFRRARKLAGRATPDPRSTAKWTGVFGSTASGGLRDTEGSLSLGGTVGIPNALQLHDVILDMFGVDLELIT